MGWWRAVFVGIGRRIFIELFCVGGAAVIAIETDSAAEVLAQTLPPHRTRHTTPRLLPHSHSLHNANKTNAKRNVSGKMKNYIRIYVSSFRLQLPDY